MKAVNLVPVALAAAVGESADDRAAGIETDEVEPARGLGHRRDHLRGSGQHAAFDAQAGLDLVGQQQPGVVADLVELGRQQLRLGLQRRPVERRHASQREAGFDAPAAAHQSQRRVALRHVGGLPHGGLVEADEMRRLGIQVQGHPVDARCRPTNHLGQRFEIAARDQRRRRWCRHAAPPNTATSVNLQAGAAWPTRITCEGSPLPQNGVPITSSVLASPTIASERQKVALMPR